MNNLNCPNCGAPVVTWFCEYCGTRFGEDPTIKLHMDNEALRNAMRIEALYNVSLNAMRAYAGLEEIK